MTFAAGNCTFSNSLLAVIRKDSISSSYRLTPDLKLRALSSGNKTTSSAVNVITDLAQTKNKTFIL